MGSDVVSTLNGLIETSRDGERGFRMAAEKSHDPQLKSLLLEYAEDCARAVQELQQCVAAMGAKPDSGGTAAGAAHRGWVNLRTATTRRDESAILQECERGEDLAKAEYQKALKAPIPPDARALVQRQYEGLLQHHDRIRELRDSYAQMS
ncbi:MAG: PA2169 family four-helix-bundle protein [Gammaproteobacteria bacterium]|nr:PA2169 family four-helix-bundle protein [Gammaproteobacteria bacterium]